jgi:hypothetical protein
MWEQLCSFERHHHFSFRYSLFPCPWFSPFIKDLLCLSTHYTIEQSPARWEGAMQGSVREGSPLNHKAPSPLFPCKCLTPLLYPTLSLVKCITIAPLEFGSFHHPLCTHTLPLLTSKESLRPQTRFLLTWRSMGTSQVRVPLRSCVEIFMCVERKLRMIIRSQRTP